MMERRTFIKNATAISTVTILRPRTVFGSGANSAIRVGIIGCGQRGTTVISSMSANTNINIIAMADLFEEQLQTALPKLNKLNAAKGFPEIARSNMYLGSKAYLKLLENKDVDAVLISSPAYTHPGFMAEAIAARKHVYCEKPVAPDVAGCKKVLEAGEKVNGAVSVVFGFQIRYATPYVEMVNRIHRGDIGNIINAQLYYLSSGSAIQQLKNVPEDKFRILNHFHFQALSGGILLDQGIHMIDICNWALRAHPVKAIGTGGRNGGPVEGDVWNNYQVVYQYPGDINMSFHSTQIGNAFGDVCCRFIGAKGIAEAHYSGGVFIKGDNAWDSGIAKGDSELTAEQRAAGVFLSSLYDADANKEKAFINSIETGKFLNEARQGAESTLTTILGREAAETKTEMTWDKVFASDQRLDTKLNLGQFDKV